MMAAEAEHDLLEIRERVSAMRTRETAHYAVPDYLSEAWQQKLRDALGNSFAAAAAAEAGDDRIQEVWREKICGWFYEVVDHFDFDREVVAVTVNYLDRYSATRPVDRRTYQLAAMTALYLAVKLYEHNKLRLASLVDLSGGSFVPGHVEAMECSLLRRLCWHVHPPTPYAYCKDLLLLLPGEVTPAARHGAGQLARFLTELAVCDYWFATQKPSAVGVAAMINALELQGVDPRHKVRFLERVGDVGVDTARDPEVVECYQRLREIYLAGDFEEDTGVRIAAVSPTGVADGPATNNSIEEMECR